ncbi:MAG: carbon starvation protein A [Thermoguttaceae bacterium]|nr:carbon starvation protein A [Thermoguttaceae bacterium]MBR5759509.1 carbon starvation protein A [Thermoguttaceae bacterium]
MSLILFGAATSYSGVMAFLGGLLILIVGYVTYGRFVEKTLGPDDRQTPAIKYNDGVDYVVLPHWKNMLIQLLNIAGIGPVIGVIAGIKFGAIVFILIPIGNIIGGATHDFIAGMASLRNRGGNLPGFIKMTLGSVYYRFFSVFMIFLLLLVVAVFINVPANLTSGMVIPGSKEAIQQATVDLEKQINELEAKGVSQLILRNDKALAVFNAGQKKVAPSPEEEKQHQSYFWYAVVLIFLYYILATMFPVDKIIGKLYPIFGAILLLGSMALLVALLRESFKDPSLLLESIAFKTAKGSFLASHPIVPCLFVTIACGILSGFHATQSPIIARTMKSEREARSSFYGMMVLEGVIAMIWAGAALAVYNAYLDFYPEFWTDQTANDVLPIITNIFLGSNVGTVTVLAVVVLAITSGDTAMRSVRLSLAEMLNIDQKPIAKRIAVCLPLIAAISILLFWSNQDKASFGKLWNYFAWGNQVLAASTLGAGCVWLYGRKRAGWISAVPCFYMTFIVVAYILWTSPEHKGPQGLGLDLTLSYLIGLFVSCIFVVWCVVRGKKIGKTGGVGMEYVDPNDGVLEADNQIND